MGSQITLEMIYEEVKRVSERLKAIEEIVEEVIIKNLPETQVSKEELRDIQRGLQEIKEGKCLTLEELKRASKYKILLHSQIKKFLETLTNQRKASIMNLECLLLF